MEDRARGLEDYTRALEDERRKIEMLQRELPLSLQLVTQAIESVKQQMGVGEAAACEQPVLEEFLPMKPSCSSSDEEDGRRRHGEAKPDWLRSVPLWNQDAEPLPKSGPLAFDGKKSGGAFHPFDKDKNRAAPQATAAAVASSSAETTAGRGAGGRGNGRLCEKKQDGQSQMQRKSRRCWSPDLHRRFLHALQQLGGSRAATPKQIRELMKVDDLTNDEVKSHLQKYRLHSRRSNRPMESNNSTSSPPPQFVVVSGIWVPPPEYSAAATLPAEGKMAPLNGIYAPVASLASEIKPNNKKEARRSASDPLHSEGGGTREDEDGVTNSPSPVTSSSSQTTTAS